MENKDKLWKIKINYGKLYKIMENFYLKYDLVDKKWFFQ